MLPKKHETSQGPQALRVREYCYVLPLRKVCDPFNVGAHHMFLNLFINRSKDNRNYTFKRTMNTNFAV